MNAGEVIDRIKRNLGVPWRDATYRDTFKFGGPDTEVTGIATTVFCSLEVVQKASAAGCNMIIPHEDTYWNDRDEVAIVSDDLLYKTKVDFMRKNTIVVFRIHDHMHSQLPDFTYVGSARAIGLDAKYETAPGSHRFVVPETTLGALAAEVKKRSGARALRVVGDPTRRSAGSSSESVMRPPRSPTGKSMWSSAASSRRPTGRWIVRNMSSTPQRSVSIKVGSCLGTPFLKKPGCSRWRGGSRDLFRKYRFNS